MSGFHGTHSYWAYTNWLFGCVLGLAWFSRIVDAGLGMRKVQDVSRPEWDRTPSPCPRVSIIVPARNEEESIAQSLRQLLALEYDNYEVIAVDDRSTDHTGELMETLSRQDGIGERLRIVHIDRLPPGWLGKTHAMWTASKLATGEWLLFTDGDVLFKPDALRRAMAYVESEAADHVVLFPRLILKGPGEKMMIAFFQSMFVFGHRPWKVADPKTKDHMGVGAFNLIRRRVYEAVGTYQALRFEVLDDMKLGKLVKTSGYPQRNVFGRDLISLRWGKGAKGIIDNVAKNFFALMSFQWPRMVASSIVVAFLNLVPFIGVLASHGWARLPYAVGLLCMFAVYVGMAAKSEFRAYYFLLHPLSTILFVYAMLRSMALTLGQGGVVWRGTKYELDELRKGLV